MRKLLAILLIVTIACNGLVETFESINENTIFDYFDLDKEAIELGFWDSIGNFFKKIWNGIKSVVDWLKEKGFWEQIKSLAKTAGKWAAKALCKKFTSSDKCGDIVDQFLGK